MEGFLMVVAARGAPSRIDEARPYYLPNKDDETEGGRAQWRCPGFAAARRRGAGRAEARRGMKRFDAVARGRRDARMCGVQAGGSIRPRKGAMNGGDGATRVPPGIRRFVEFYQAFGGHYLIFERLH
ncbi:TPA: hypothetical protein SAY52_000165 [Burkholderia cenocepacia]|uniref:hypothetical protein n=1 Tax=Burkholderia sp. BCC0801 TaxID=2676291 RepID=UPI00158BBCED|nr:hypothetical protein [Burkholderia sp. BCC0801]HEF5869615.1 hypothetical protein [Burkholderia cenocepacia]